MKTLEDLRAANLPRCNWRDFLKTVENESLSEEGVKALDEHFRHFVPPGPCIKCGAQQGGDILAHLLGLTKFTWGITHGHGFCSVKQCGWPAQAYHYDIGPIKKLVLILQLHPDEVTLGRSSGTEASNDQAD